MREEVKWFAELMEKELKANDHKGGWGDCSAMSLMVRLTEEVDELWCAVLYGHGDIKEEAADVANFAMMVATKSPA